MKKFLLPLIAMLFCMTACNKDNEGILKLEVEQYTSNAKVHLDNNYAVWDNNDEVWVNGTSYEVSVNGTSAALTGVAENTNGYKAVYPASWVNSSATASSDIIGITYPAERTYRTNTAGQQIIDAPMAAYSDGGTLKFHNLGSVLAVNVTNSNSEAMSVQKIEVSSESLINGTYNVLDITTAPRLQITLGGGGRTTTLLCNGVSIAAGATKTFYIAMPTHYASATADCGFSPQLTIKVYDQYYTYTKTQASAHTMEANHGYNAPIATTDSPVQYAPMSNQIKYVTSDGSLLKGWSGHDRIACNPVGMTWSTLGLCTSNVYYGTYGIITFENPITTIGYTEANGGEYVLFVDNDYYNYSGAHNIIDIFLPEGVQSLGDWAFSIDNTYTGTISIPSTVTSITEGALKNHVSRLEMHNPEPPTLSGTGYQFFGTNNTILHVPAGSKDDYISSTWGPLFGNGTRIVDDL